MTLSRRTVHLLLAALLAVALAMGAAACGDDDDAGASADSSGTTADASTTDGETQLAQRAAHRFSLRVEDACLGPHEHRRPHPSTTCGSARYSSNGWPVSSSNAST